MNRIQESMEQLQASQELKKSTLQYLEQKRAQKNRFSWQPAFGLLAAAACLFLVLGMGGYSVYRRPVSYISIDVNPSIELGINRFDRVVSAQAYNADGQDILEHVTIKNTPYLEALETLLQDENCGRYLSRESCPVFTIVSKESDVIAQEISADELLQQYKTQTYTSDTACMREAHQHEMSFGKYRAYLELLEYDENVSVEDCHGMTIGEIQNRIDSCQQNHGKGGHGRHKGHHGNASGH